MWLDSAPACWVYCWFLHVLVSFLLFVLYRNQQILTANIVIEISVQNVLRAKRLQDMEGCCFVLSIFVWQHTHDGMSDIRHLFTASARAACYYIIPYLDMIIIWWWHGLRKVILMEGYWTTLNRDVFRVRGWLLNVSSQCCVHHLHLAEFCRGIFTFSHLADALI